MKTVDLNCDMGESFGPWGMGDDEAMLDIVSSANIACGFHAGDPVTMARTMQMAHERGVRIGAHPGFADLQGFGRRELSLSDEELSALVRYQLGAALGVAKSIGAELSHLKLHGAIANMAGRDADMALTLYRAARSVQGDIPLMVIAGTKQAEAAAALGGPVISEIFADRSYEPDASLTPRSEPGAVLHDAEKAAARVVEMVSRGGVLTREGELIPVKIDSICVHGDTKGAVALAREVRARLEADGVTLKAPR